MFFLTICCAPKGANQLCRPEIAKALFAAAQFYHVRNDWFVRIMLLMPDHLHALVAPAPDKPLRELVSSWKRYVSASTGIHWQKNFFDHRLRSGESTDQKMDYIRKNPVRAGLMKENETWPFLIES